MRLFIALAGTLVATGLGATAAFGQSRDEMTTMWTVRAEPPGETPVTVNRGEPILEQKLLPAGLAVLDDPFDGGEIRRPLPAGSQLFEVQFKSAAVYCAFDYKPPSTVSRLLSRAAVGSQLCFVDATRDGRFESYFVAGNATPSLPGIYGPLPKKLRTMTPRAYHSEDPATFSGDLSVSIVYTGKGLVNNVRRYAVFFGSKEERQRLTADTVSHGKAFPLTVETMGALISVLSGSGQTIEAKVVRSMPAQPFAVVRTVTTIIY